MARAIGRRLNLRRVSRIQQIATYESRSCRTSFRGIRLHGCLIQKIRFATPASNLPAFLAVSLLA